MKIFNSLILFLPSILFAADLQTKIEQLEQNIQMLQQQIDDLKQKIQPTTDGSALEQRIANLESYAVQLRDALVDIQNQVEDNKTTVDQISQTQDDQPHLGMYGSIVVGQSGQQHSVIDGQSFEIILSGQPHSRLSYFTEIEFERAAAVGGERGGEVLLEQAYTDIQLVDWASFRAGILLVPFGNIKRDHYSPLREVISKPLTSYALAPSDWTDNGFGLTGHFSLNSNNFLDYQAYIIAGLDDQISSTGLRDARQKFGVDNNANKAIVGKLDWQNIDGQSIALSLYRGAWDDKSRYFINGLSIDFNYRWRWLDFTGEYNRMSIDRPIQGQALMDGFYIRSIASIDAFLSPNWLGEDFENAQLQFVLQYDQVDIENVLDANIENNWEKRWTFGLRLLPVSAWVLNFNYESSRAGGPDLILRGQANTWLFSIGYVF